MTPKYYLASFMSIVEVHQCMKLPFRKTSAKLELKNHGMENPIMVRDPNPKNPRWPKT